MINSMFKKFLFQQKEITALAIPIFLGLISMVVNQLFDAIWISRYSVFSVGSITTSSFTENVLYGIALLVTIGITVLVSNRIGQKNYKDVKGFIITGWIMVLIIILFVSVFGFYFRNEIAYFTIENDESKILLEVESLYSIIFPFIGILFLQMMIDSIFNGYKNTKIPMMAAIIANIINLCLDPLFIYGYFGIPKLGVIGALIATIIGRLIALIWSFYKLNKSKFIKDLKLVKMDLNFDFFNFAKQILKVGIPLSLDFLIRMVGGLLLLKIISSFGDIEISAYGICTRLLILITSSFFAIRQATSIIVARKKGEGKEQDIKTIAESSYMIGIIVSISSLIVFLIAGNHILKLFTDNYKVLNSSLILLFYYSIYLFPYAIYITLGGTYVGYELGKQILITTFIGVILQILLAYNLSNFFNSVQGIWIGMIIASSVQSIVLLLYFYRVIISHKIKYKEI